jgi:hypothetical protein
MSTLTFTNRYRAPFKQLLHTEAKLWLREPMAPFWGIVFPLVLTIVFGLASNKPQHDLGGLRLIDVYVPTLMAFVLTVVAVSALPSMLTAYRNIGVLRRMSTTPVAPWLLLEHLSPEVAPPGWRPVFLDYLHLGFTNATAFSPADVVPLTHRAKYAMLVQSTVALTLFGLVVARAVNAFT